MKTSSMKILGCAAVCALLTITRAQTPDDAQPVPPPDTSVQQQGQPDGTAPQPGIRPNVIVVPVPTEAIQPDMTGTNFDSGNMSAQPGPSGPPTTYRVIGGSNQPQGGRNNNYNNYSRDRNRGNRGSQQTLTSGPSSPNSFPAPAGGTNGTEDLYLDFHGAQIDQVLNYLSDAAGFIIDLQTRVSGTVDVWSSHPVSRDEAVQILNSVLNKNGFAAVRSGRTLHIMSKENAMRGQIPVIIGNDPDNIPLNDEIVTQIIPIRFVQARQLIIDLSSLTQSPSIIANDAGNSIIVTDTQANIHHLVELVKAIDGSAEDVTEVRPFHLQYHDPVEVANLISSVFADQSNGQGGGQAPIRFGGFGGQGGFGGGAGGFGGFGGFGGRGGQGGGGGLRALFGGGGGGQQGGQQAVRQKAKVVAVADQRTSSVIVTAPKDLMTQIEELVTQIDQASPKVSRVSVVHLENADPQQVLKVLQQFQGANARNAQSSQNSPLMTRENQNTSSSSSGFGTTGFGGGGGGFGSGGGGGGGNFGGGGFGGGNFGGGGFRGGGQ